MSEKEKQVDMELQGKVLDMMFGYSDVGGGVTKCEIYDEVFDGNSKVRVDGKEYGIYDVPGLKQINGSPKIIQRAIEKYIVGHGAPLWSQIVNGVIEEQSFQQLVSYPKTVYLKS